MDYLSLSLTMIFVLIALFLSKSFKAGVEKDMIIATIRAAVQLLLIGYILSLIFHSDHPAFIILMVLLMLAVAAQNVAKRKKITIGSFWRVFLTLAIVEIVTQGILLALQVIPLTARYVIPISGMVIGNSMVLASLFLNQLGSEITVRKEEIQLILSLGGTPKQSIQHILTSCMKTSMIPTLESQKTLGLVQLPGMMTGQILAGADPIQAVRFQLLIVFTTMASAALTCVILSMLTYPSLFTVHQQLKQQS
ncbi:ABC transporter permease [Bacillus atrophaeus]|uniref:ABC transporter permease n=1 Tax=Bacillus atrophaeus TaxID=1452 RepID=UPI00228016DC|nr:iron export ABC transporter permease subunit FetB [Bacillus atrophaeus]MCY8512250.1 iron export ABC transporter permease subunit FetB [Bacillus atrophaeus]MCY8993063.1 iron export ABC transporter permease subunit FetB [Bacillus atrophaeus]